MTFQALTLTQEDWTRFLAADGLAEKCGVPRTDFPFMVCKELLDNALDAGGAVTFEHRYDGSMNEAVIADEGRGIAQDQIEHVFSIKRALVSSKHWRMGNRGALGNGLRAVMGGLYALNGWMVIESLGRASRVRLNDMGDTVVEDLGTSDRAVGTRVTATFGGHLANADLLQCAVAMQGPVMRGSRPSPRWFDVEAIRDLQRSAGTLSVTDFVGQFGTRFQPADGLVADYNAALLRDGMAAQATADPTIIPIGSEAFWGEYAIERGITDGIPFCVEVFATASKDDAGDCASSLFLNRTPALGGLAIEIRDKGRVTVYVGGRWYGAPAADRDRLTLRRTVGFDLTVWISSPYIPILSSGKAPDLTRFVAATIKAIVKAGRKAQAQIKGKARQGVTIKDAVERLLPAAYAAVSANGTYAANVRQLMYEMRPDILRMTGMDGLGDKHVTQTCIPDFIRDNPELTAGWKIAFDRRGSLIEPHTGARVDLGTTEVDGYLETRLEYRPVISRQHLVSAAPEDRFAGLLFVEKEGFNELIEASGLLEEFDLCLASSKGMSVTALRTLIDEMAQRNPDFRVFTLTDFDITGSSIRETLTGDTRRFTYANKVNVTPLAITWEMAQRLHDEGRSEPSGVDDLRRGERTAERLEGHGLEPDAIGFLLDDGGLRVELNALRPADLLQVLRAGLVDAGLEKVIPSEETLAAGYHEIVIMRRLAEVERILMAATPAAVPDDLYGRVAAILAADRTLSWDQAVGKVLALGSAVSPA